MRIWSKLHGLTASGTSPDSALTTFVTAKRMVSPWVNGARIAAPGDFRPSTKSAFGFSSQLRSTVLIQTRNAELGTRKGRFSFDAIGIERSGRRLLTRFEDGQAGVLLEHVERQGADAKGEPAERGRCQRRRVVENELG